MPGSGGVRQSEGRLARRPSAKNDLLYCTIAVVMAVLLELTTSCVFAVTLAVLVSVLPAAAFTLTVRVIGPQECAGRSKPVRAQVKVPVALVAGWVQLPFVVVKPT